MGSADCQLRKKLMTPDMSIDGYYDYRLNIFSHPRIAGGEHHGNRVTEDRHQRRRRRTLGHTLLLLLRDDPGPARHFSAVFHGWIEIQRVLPLDNLELRTTNRGRRQRGVGTVP